MSRCCSALNRAYRDSWRDSEGKGLVMVTKKKQVLYLVADPRIARAILKTWWVVNLGASWPFAL